MKMLPILVALLLSGQVSSDGHSCTKNYDHHPESCTDELPPTDVVKDVHLPDGRAILAHRDGKTLYTFDEDGPGVSNCTEGCLAVWPPVLVTAENIVHPPYGVLERGEAGEMQLTLNGQPLYFYVADRKEGDIRGDNLGGVWHIIVIGE